MLRFHTPGTWCCNTQCSILQVLSNTTHVLCIAHIVISASDVFQKHEQFHHMGTLITMIKSSFFKKRGHLTNHPVYQYYGAVRIFYPRQLPTLQHDIQPYAQHIKQLDKPSHQLLEEWLIYSRYKEVAPPLAELEAFWTTMAGRFPL